MLPFVMAFLAKKNKLTDEKHSEVQVQAEWMTETEKKHRLIDFMSSLLLTQPFDRKLKCYSDGCEHLGDFQQ